MVKHFEVDVIEDGETKVVILDGDSADDVAAKAPKKYKILRIGACVLTEAERLAAEKAAAAAEKANNA